MDKIINFDQMIKKKKYRNENKDSYQHPCLGVMFGKSGSGKSTAMTNAIVNPLTKMTFDRLYLYAKQLDEDLYAWLIEKFEKVQAKKNKKRPPNDQVQIIWTGSSLDEVVPLDQMDPSYQNLVIFDDMITESEANQHIILEYFIRGIKRSCSTSLKIGSSL